MFLSIGMLKQKYFLTDIFILSAEKQPIKLSWRKIEWLQIEIPCREWYGDRVLIGDEFISADGDKINDKIKSVLLKISELGIAERKDLNDLIFIP